MTDLQLLEEATRLLKSKSAHHRLLGRQLLFSKIPPSYFIEKYLYNNEGMPQDLALFPMMKYIYDNLPQELLLKCSRKTLKSTLISNIMALNMIRYNYYPMMYVGNSESTAKKFSANYFMARFNSPRVREILSKGFSKEDVFEKVLDDTKSSVIFTYVSNDATRTRGPSVSENLLDEVQGIEKDQLPIIEETMAMIPHKRKRYAGTPLSSGNTIGKLWKESDQREWVTKCTGCNHWNMMVEANHPEKMLLEKGYSCSKCSKILNTIGGEWVKFSTSKTDLHGYHLCQPMLPFFNSKEYEWSKIYKKVEKYDQMSLYNEVLGLDYDADSVKPITLDQLMNACTLGPMTGSNGTLDIFERNRGRYRLYTGGTDWGVSNISAYTVSVLGAMRDDGIYEVFWMKKFKNLDYESHIREISRRLTDVNAKFAADSGPDPIRGQKLIEQSGGPTKGLLVRYEHGKFITRFDMPPNATDWRQGRFVLHRSDVMGFMFNLIKQRKIVFPRWEDCGEFLQDLLNVYIEYKDGILRQEQFYRHKADEPDDFAHALTYAAVCAYYELGDPNLLGSSSSSSDNMMT